MRGLETQLLELQGQPQERESQLTERGDQVEQLTAECAIRDERLASLEVRLERIESRWPVRLYRRVQALLRRLKIKP